MSWLSEERSSYVLNPETPSHSPKPGVRLTFQRCDEIETKKSRVVTKGITSPKYICDLKQMCSLTPESRIKRREDFSPLFESFSKRNTNSPMTPHNWQKFNSSIKKPMYDDTPLDYNFGRRNDKWISENLIGFNELDIPPLPNTQSFKSSCINFHKIKTGHQLTSNAKTIVSNELAVQEKKPISETSIVEIQESAPAQKTCCNCRNSKCLKKYCECLRKGGFCGPGCNCQDCENHTLSEIRGEKIKAMMKKNVSAFEPPMANFKDVWSLKVHSKGCNCKKSNCLKNYCECHQAGAKCGESCKCISCKNTGEDFGFKSSGEHLTPKNIALAPTRSEIDDRDCNLMEVSFS